MRNSARGAVVVYGEYHGSTTARIPHEDKEHDMSTTTTTAPTYTLAELLTDFSHYGTGDVVDMRDIAEQLRNYADAVDYLVGRAADDGGVIVRDTDDEVTVTRARCMLQFVAEMTSVTGNCDIVPPVVVVNERADDGSTTRRATPVVVAAPGDDESPLVTVLNDVADEVEDMHDNGTTVVVPDESFTDYVKEWHYEVGDATSVTGHAPGERNPSPWNMNTVAIDPDSGVGKLLQFVNWDDVANEFGNDWNEFDYNGIGYRVQ